MDFERGFVGCSEVGTDLDWASGIGAVEESWMTNTVSMGCNQSVTLEQVWMAAVLR